MWRNDDISNFIIEIEKMSSKYSIVVIDIDYLIRFCMRFSNDEIGAIVKNILEFFKRKLPDDVYIWQSEGDEFLIYYPQLDKFQLKPIFSKLKREFRKQRFAQNSSKVYSNVAMTYSAGIASFPQDGKEFKEIIRKSMVAMFMAKAFRRDRVFLASDSNKSDCERLFIDRSLKIKVHIGHYGETGFAEKAVPYKKARLWEPQAIDVDSDGNIYIADQNNHAILKFDGAYVSTIAGNGQFGYSGDGGMAVKACLNKPTGICIHANHLYITDTGNDVVRCVKLNEGTICTIAGIGEAGCSGDGEQANKARLNKPGGAAVDNEGNLYINDIANNLIRKVDVDGIITTYAGTGEYGYTGDGGEAIKATFAEIYGIAMDKTCGDLFLADYFNHCIRKIDKATGIISTVVGCGEEGYSGDGGHALKARISRPVAIYIGEYGDIFIAESGNSCIRFVSKEEETIYTLVGDGVFGIGKDGLVEDFRLANPSGVVMDKHKTLFILDGANNRICKIDTKNIRR